MRLQRITQLPQTREVTDEAGRRVRVPMRTGAHRFARAESDGDRLRRRRRQSSGRQHELLRLPCRKPKRSRKSATQCSPASSASSRCARNSCSSRLPRNSKPSRDRWTNSRLPFTSQTRTSLEGVFRSIKRWANCSATRRISAASSNELARARRKVEEAVKSSAPSSVFYQVSPSRCTRRAAIRTSQT